MIQIVEAVLVFVLFAACTKQRDADVGRRPESDLIALACSAGGPSPAAVAAEKSVDGDVRMQNIVNDVVQSYALDNTIVLKRNAGVDDALAVIAAVDGTRLILYKPKFFEPR